MTSSMISTIYSTLFFVLSAAMFIVLIPQKAEFTDYKKARHTMGTAFLIIGLFGLYRSFVTAQPTEVYITACVISLICIIFSVLNFLGFLYISETSQIKIRKSFRYAALGGIIVLAASASGLIFREIHHTVKIINNIVYASVSTYLFIVSLIEYRKVQHKIDGYYADSRTDISWMKVLLWCTYVLSIMMIAAFWIRDIRSYIGFASMFFYTYMTFKVLSFVPATIDSVRHDTNLAETEEEEKEIEMEETPPAKTFRDYSRKIEPLIRQWVESEHFLRPSITIREVANEMGTNHNYLSTYLNQVMDISFTTWLNTLRVEKSKEYLASEERFSIEECGAKVGIPESYNFSRWFKIVTGMSPVQYRKSLRSK